MQFKLVTTKDNSHTLYVPELNEHYHSIHGAIQESQHVFIESGMNYLSRNSVKIFEVGFGTGLNALLTYLNATKKNIKINYHSIELNPLPERVYKKLNYSDILSIDKNIFRQLHELKWGDMHQLTSNFSLLKIHNDILNYYINDEYDIIYFDAFGPEVQPEIWEEKVFMKLFEALKMGGIITTYSAKGIIKRKLVKIGFKVETIPGPPGKREMIRAVKR
ncbi:MAG: tRNA (5-methylaminomethyl-2-thiouridine)(34)-methyltransferase MnmD [Bacteroidales bacterium]|nr:tRNA (5-methylaminomethyl-2-thiouridine)(34)-methyltransferase MnmD [Bacteroidales bacterium]